MSLFPTALIEDKILLSVTLIDALLLAILLLIAIRKATSPATSYAILYCIVLILFFLFLHDQIYTFTETTLRGEGLDTNIILKRSVVEGLQRAKEQSKQAKESSYSEHRRRAGI